MIKKIVISTLFLLGFCLSLKANSVDSYILPEKFYVTQRWFSLTLTFDIKTPEDIPLGKVYRTFFSLRTEYNFYDCEEKIKAKARLRWISLYPVFDISGEFEEPLGRVECYILTILPKYDIISPEGHQQALAKLNFWGTKFTMSDPVTRGEIAIATRPYFAFKDKWCVTITNPELFKSKQIDPRLFITMLAFQTDKEYWENQSSYVTNANFDCELNALDSHFQTHTRSTALSLKEEDFIVASALLDPVIEKELELSNSDEESLKNIIYKSFNLIENTQMTDEQKTAIYQLLKMKMKDFKKDF